MKYDENKKILYIDSLDITNEQISCFSPHVEEIIMDDNITKINDALFIKFINLKKIKLPSNLITIGAYAFSCCANLEEINIPNNVKKIDNNAFYCCKNLKNIYLPNSLEYLGECVFCNCISLEKVNIPSKIQFLQNRLFKECRSLKHINLNKNITRIGIEAFKNCASLKEISIPNSVTSIESKAFYGCSSIKHIHIPKNILDIEIEAFNKMYSLEKITVDSENKIFVSVDNDTVLLKKDADANYVLFQYAVNCDTEEFTIGCFEEYMGTIGTNEDEVEQDLYTTTCIYDVYDYAFEGAKKLKKIYFHSEMDYINGNAFIGCDNLKELEIDAATFGRDLSTTCRDYTYFFDKTKNYFPFEKITIHDGIRNLSDGISALFSNAKEVNLPNTLERIGKNVFSKAKKLKYLKIPETIIQIDPDTFDDDIIIDLPEIGKIKASEFSMLQTKKDNDDLNNAYAKVYCFKNGDYYIKIDNYDIVKISKQDIINFSKTSRILVNSPELMIGYLIYMLDMQDHIDDMIPCIIETPKYRELFEKFAIETENMPTIARKKNI